MARNGTIFLDEIGEMPAKLQSKLLRALEYRRFKRLGGTRDIEFTARIVAATNRDLLDEVAHKNFRGDLFYRLNVLPVKRFTGHHSAAAGSERGHSATAETLRKKNCL
jgi:transcriptional regulator with GAF, ATPase, and Fis domain